MFSWRKDFIWTRRGVTVRDTGTFIPFSPALLSEAWLWIKYYRREKARQPLMSAPFTVSFSPSPVRPWYLIRAVMMRAGAKVVSPDMRAKVAVAFHDLTVIPAKGPGSIRRPEADIYLNFECLDISKSHVANVFEEIFGYALTVDPRSYKGPIACKSETNGAHDGHIVQGPVEPKPGWVYQKLVDTSTPRDTAQDLRCPTIKGQIPLVYIKERPLSDRFANVNATCQMSTADAHFSPDELEKISQFCQKMRLDWGGLDILRDNSTKRLYIVDVNKTDMGPPLVLPMDDKLTSTTLLAKAFTRILGLDAA